MNDFLLNDNISITPPPNQNYQNPYEVSGQHPDDDNTSKIDEKLNETFHDFMSSLQVDNYNGTGKKVRRVLIVRKKIR